MWKERGEGIPVRPVAGRIDGKSGTGLAVRKDVQDDGSGAAIGSSERVSCGCVGNA